MENKPPEVKKNNRSRYSFTSLCLSFFSIIPMLGFVFSILAIIFGFLGFSEIKREGKTGKGLAIAGVVISLVFLVSYGAYFIYISRDFERMMEEVRSTPEFQDKARQVADTVIASFVGFVERYKIDNGVYPSSIEELRKIDALKNRKDNLDLIVQYKRSIDGSGYELVYVGIDGQFGTEDDIKVTK